MSSIESGVQSSDRLSSCGTDLSSMNSVAAYFNVF